MFCGLLGVFCLLVYFTDWNSKITFPLSQFLLKIVDLWQIPTPGRRAEIPGHTCDRLVVSSQSEDRFLTSNVNQVHHALVSASLHTYTVIQIAPQIIKIQLTISK